jgi:hypothetical protein
MVMATTWAIPWRRVLASSQRAGMDSKVAKNVHIVAFWKVHLDSLTVVTDNHAAHHIYQKVGFVEEGRLRQVCHREGVWCDRYAMGMLKDELR